MKHAQVVSAVSILLSLAGCASLTGAGTDPHSMDRMMSGVWVLDEWHAGGAQLRPPQIDGRWIVSDGRIIFMSRNGTPQAKQVTTVGLGTYKLSKGEFAYAYHAFHSFTEEAGRANVSHQLPAGGAFIKFAASREGGALVLRNSDGLEFKYSGDRMLLSNKGQVVRVWRRVNSAD